ITTSFRLQGDDGRTQVYVNPYTASIVGADRYEGSFLQWVYDLHVYLLMGKSGLVANAIGGFALLGMCVTGLVLWWPRGNRMAQGFAINLKASWKRQVYDLHKVGGVLALLPLALLAVTGAYWGFPQQYEAALGLITGGPGRVNAPILKPDVPALRPDVPALRPDVPALRPDVPAQSGPSLDAMLRLAQQQIPEGEATLVTFSSAPDRPYTVRMHIPGDWRTIGDHSVYFHSADGSLVETVRHPQLPLGARLQRDIYGLHFGTFGGHATRILWIFVGLLGAGLFLSSLLMYSNRVLVKRWRKTPGGAVSPVNQTPGQQQPAPASAGVSARSA
ncbi:MAG: PepSY domain-containing protein, partial [Bryobacterales bacterium]|nr:PepSY domain-containing protein [Bryobacterales bacterium]